MFPVLSIAGIPTIADPKLQLSNNLPSLPIIQKVPLSSPKYNVPFAPIIIAEETVASIL